MFCRTAPTPIRRSSTRRLQQFLGELRKRPDLTGVNTFYPADVAADSSSTSIARRRSRSACRSATCSTRCRARWARCTSTTSTSSATRTACRCRPTARIALEARGPRQRLRALVASGEMLPVKSLICDQARRRARPARPLQRLPLGEGARQQCAGRELGAGDRRGRGGRARSRCPPATRSPWTGQAFQEKRIGRRRDHRVHVRARDGVPDPVGELRALVAAGRPCCSPCRSRCSARCSRCSFRGMQQRRLLPDRPAWC